MSTFDTVSCITALLKQTIEKSIYKDCGEGKSRKIENSVLKIEFSNKGPLTLSMKISPCTEIGTSSK